MKTERVSTVNNNTADKNTKQRQASLSSTSALAGAIALLLLTSGCMAKMPLMERIQLKMAETSQSGDGKTLLADADINTLRREAAAMPHQKALQLLALVDVIQNPRKFRKQLNPKKLPSLNLKPEVEQIITEAANRACNRIIDHNADTTALATIMTHAYYYGFRLNAMSLPGLPDMRYMIFDSRTGKGDFLVGQAIVSGSPPSVSDARIIGLQRLSLEAAKRQGVSYAMAERNLQRSLTMAHRSHLLPRFLENPKATFKQDLNYSFGPDDLEAIFRDQQYFLDRDFMVDLLPETSPRRAAFKADRDRQAETWAFNQLIYYREIASYTKDKK